MNDTQESLNVLKIIDDMPKNPNGFVFITYSEGSRGTNIKGIEPSTVIINQRFASGTELDQSMGRGNRTLDNV